MYLRMGYVWIHKDYVYPLHNIYNFICIIIAGKLAVAGVNVSTINNIIIFDLIKKQNNAILDEFQPRVLSNNCL